MPPLIDVRFIVFTQSYLVAPLLLLPLSIPQKWGAKWLKCLVRYGDNAGGGFHRSAMEILKSYQPIMDSYGMPYE